MKLEKRDNMMWAIEHTGAEWPYMTVEEYEASLNRQQPDPIQEQLQKTQADMQLALDGIAELMIGGASNGRPLPKI